MLPFSLAPLFDQAYILFYIHFLYLVTLLAAKSLSYSKFASQIAKIYIIFVWIRKSHLTNEDCCVEGRQLLAPSCHKLVVFLSARSNG